MNLETSTSIKTLLEEREEIQEWIYTLKICHGAKQAQNVNVVHYNCGKNTEFSKDSFGI